jgi:hypothetical protein
MRALQVRNDRNPSQVYVKWDPTGHVPFTVQSLDARPGKAADGTHALWPVVSDKVGAETFGRANVAVDVDGTKIISPIIRLFELIIR